MQLQDRINALEALGKHLNTISENEIDELAYKAEYYNPWFTVPNVMYAFSGIKKFLERDSLQKLASNYTFNNSSKTIGLIMAGNIPLVGFHDLLCVLISGHKAMIKLSSKDEVLPNFVFDQLNEVAPELRQKIQIEERLKNFDAVIATGSDNSSRYFEYYFSKYPHVIRKNRTSIAVISGNETEEELSLLTDDIFRYYGMGCRNVSKILAPEGYDFGILFRAMERYNDVANHNKYRNNYDYYKSIYLVNGDDFLDNGFVMLKKDIALVSPVSVIYYDNYFEKSEAESYIKENKEKIQVVVASDNLKISDSVPPGKTQLPEIDDFADRVDTMKFLTEL